MKIRTKLILAHLFVVLFLLGSLTYLLMKRSSDIVYKHIIENASLSLAQISLNLDNKLESYEEIANTLFVNTSMNMILDQRYTDPLEAYEVYAQQFQPFVAAVQTTKDVFHVNVYTDNPTFLFANVTLIDDEVRASDWYGPTMASRSGGYWSKPYKVFRQRDPVISFNKRLNNIDRRSPSVVSLEVTVGRLTELVGEESKSKRVLFMQADGTVIIDSGGSRPIERIDQLPFAGRIMEEETGSFPVRMGKESYQIVFRTLDSRSIVKGMKVVAFIPVTELMPQIYQLRSLAYALFALAFLISAALILMITVGLTRRLSELSLRMKRVHKDNFQSFIAVKGRDEVAQLGEMFNLMVLRLGQLIREVYQAEINRKEQAYRTKEVELYAMQAQINPHFLFNVLNAIRGKLLVAGERETAKVVGLLAKSFRVMLRGGGQQIRLAEEIDFVETYLQIQQYRFGHKFTYRIDIPQERMEVSIPKLIVQPLVENAISHAIELSPRPAHIRIAGETVGDRLRLTVSDDGLGISPARLAEIKRWLEERNALSMDTHIGLRNVHARLKYVYGDEYGLRIESAEGEGTTVTMKIPLHVDSKEENRGESDV